MDAQESQPAYAPEVREKALNKRLDGVGWGLFLIMLGGLWLAPQGLVPEGVGLIGAGLIMLGINLARHFAGVKISGVTIVLGAFALVGGIADITGVEGLPVFGVMLVIVGATLLLKPLFDRR